jgi:predicted Zn-dependent protease
LAPGLGLQAPAETARAEAAPPPGGTRRSVTSDLAAALQAMKENRFEDALAGLEAVVEVDPANRVALMNLPVVLMRLFRHREAKEVTDRLVVKFPRDPAILNNAAWLYATADDPQLRDGGKAVALAQEALLQLPSNYHVWSTLSEAYYINGQFARSLQAAEEALRLANSAEADFEILMEYRSQIKRANTMQQAFSLVE